MFAELRELRTGFEHDGDNGNGPYTAKAGYTAAKIILKTTYSKSLSLLDSLNPFK